MLKDITILKKIENVTIAYWPHLDRYYINNYTYVTILLNERGLLVGTRMITYHQ